MSARIFGFGTIAVSGTSMEPTFSDGDWLLAKWRRNTESALRAKISDVIVIEREFQPGIFYIKRIAEISQSSDGTPQIFVLSDNPDGTDSRKWGPLHCSEIKAQVIGRVKKSSVKKS